MATIQELIGEQLDAILGAVGTSATILGATVPCTFDRIRRGRVEVEGGFLDEYDGVAFFSRTNLPSIPTRKNKVTIGSESFEIIAVKSSTMPLVTVYLKSQPI